MSLILDGTNGLTFNNSTTQNSGGKVLQVVSAVVTTGQSYTNAGSPQNTGLTASITPLFSTSKILVLASQQCELAANTNVSTYLNLYVLRNGTSVQPFGGCIMTQLGTGSNGYQDVQQTVPILYLDSPATTSAITYSLQGFANNTGSGVTQVMRFNNVVPSGGAFASTITLMEIAQ